MPRLASTLARQRIGETCGEPIFIEERGPPALDQHITPSASSAMVRMVADRGWQVRR